MAKIKDNQKENASAFMGAIWNELIKPYYNPEESDEWWETVVKKVDQLGAKYHCDKDPRLLHMMTGFIRGLEKESKNRMGTTP